ncbi:MAG TPA: NAD(P)-dependent alcohol dehydrogenase [Nitrospiraceae bacterium]|jgi:uncharacterized zinc-type alcohol dehydrogenase-like protein
MLPTRGYAARSATSLLEPFTFERREPGPHDVLVEILYCGICHSDIHQTRDEWGGSIFPMVPGHEIVGRVERIGSQVTRFKVGELAGVGTVVDSCRVCESCKEGLEQYCDRHASWTYNGTEQDQKTPTYGGYSSHIVVDERFTLRIPPKLPLANVAPLLCAGITTYSPLRHFNVGRGQKVGIVGLGGLGHMAVKLAASMGAEVTVFSTSKTKEQDARRLGAQEFVISLDSKNFAPLANRFDLILDAVSAPHDVNAYLGLLRRDGAMVMVGVPAKPLEVETFSLILKRRKLTGSGVGGLRETQEMLDYCAQHNVTADVEMVPIQEVNQAYDKTLKGAVRYRFVIDMKSL